MKINGRLLITNVVMYLIIALCLYFCQGMVLADFKDPTRMFDITEYILFFAGLTLVIFFYFYTERKVNKHSPSWIIAIVLFILFIFNTIVILKTPNEINVVATDGKADFTGIYYLSNEDKGFYILSGGVALFMVYFLLTIVPKKIRYNRQINIFLYAVLAVAIAAIIYSLCTEIDKYPTLFDDPSKSTATKSFFINPNNYGSMLFFATFACLYIHHIHTKWWWFLLAVFFFANSLFTLNRINIALGIISILLYLIGRFFITYKKHKIRNFITLGSIAAFFVACFAIHGCYILSNKTFCAPVVEPVLRIIEYVAKANVASRQIIWENALRIINNSSWAFGQGYTLFNNLLKYYQTINLKNDITLSPHNGYLQIIGEGGIISISIFALIFIYTVFAAVRIFKTHKNTVLLCGVFTLYEFSHMIVEGDAPMFMSVPLIDYFLVSLFSFIPILSAYYHKCHPSDRIAIQENAKQVINPRSVPSYYVQVFSLIMSPFAGLFAGFIPMLANFEKWSIILGFVLYAAFLLFNILILLLSKTRDRSTAFETFAIYSIGLSVCCLIPELISYFIKIDSFAVKVYIGLIVLFLYYASFIVIKPLQKYISGPRAFVYRFNYFFVKVFSKNDEVYSLKEKLTLYERFQYLLFKRKYKPGDTAYTQKDFKFVEVKVISKEQKDIYTVEIQNSKNESFKCKGYELLRRFK